MVSPLDNRGAAVGEAAVLIWGNLGRQIRDHAAHARATIPSIIPVYGIAWHRAAMQLVKRETINEITRKLRNSLLPRQEYGRLDAFLKDAFSDAVAPPPEFLDWGAISERHRFDTAFGWGALLSAC